jgi:Cyclin, N-terminal domain/Cyclin, C-terminal domain
MLNPEEALATVSAMRHKEQTDYKCDEYIYCRGGLSPVVDAGGGRVDELCRRLMAEWCLKVVDRCSFARETAAIAMSMLDRFLGTPQGNEAMNSRNVFQLASMTCLYTAIKVHESEALQPQTIVQLSRGIFTIHEIEQMELRILFAIRWRTNPPTALVFVQHFLAAAATAPQVGIQQHRRQLLELAKLQIELTLVDYKYAITSPSSIAYAALSNAFHMLEIPNPAFMTVLSVLVELNDMEAQIIQKDLKRQVQHQHHERLQVVVTEATKTTTQATSMVRQQQLDLPKAMASSMGGGHSSPREVCSVDQ